ncbi:MAG: hypothetical protein ABI221_00880 [Candidatus Saccharimonadales bacterium]
MKSKEQTANTPRNLSLDTDDHYQYLAVDGPGLSAEELADRVIATHEGSNPIQIIRCIRACRALEHSVRTVYGPDFVDGFTESAPLDGIALAMAIQAASQPQLIEGN